MLKRDGVQLAEYERISAAFILEGSAIDGTLPFPIAVIVLLKSKSRKCNSLQSVE